MNLIVKKFDKLSNRQVYEILKSRSEVFILEQHIMCLDMDDTDYNSNHCFIEDKGRVIAYLRVFKTDEKTVKIGRVLTLKHGVGHGTELMNKSIEYIKTNLNCNKIYLDSQKHAVGFYEKFGFEVVSDEFLEEGIIHLKMELNL